MHAGCCELVCWQHVLCIVCHCHIPFNSFWVYLLVGCLSFVVCLPACSLLLFFLLFLRYAFCFYLGMVFFLVCRNFCMLCVMIFGHIDCLTRNSVFGICAFSTSTSNSSSSFFLVARFLPELRVGYYINYGALQDCNYLITCWINVFWLCAYKNRVKYINADNTYITHPYTGASGRAKCATQTLNTKTKKQNAALKKIVHTKWNEYVGKTTK